MTLPTSGALSLNDIKGEFGGPTAPSLGDYYAGGTYVPAGTSGTNGAVPSSGTISISSFYGTTKFSISGGTTSVSGSSSRFGAGFKTVVTSTASAGTVVGGTAPISYLWEYVSGDTGFGANSGTSSSTAFSIVLYVAGGETTVANAVWRCKVTDNSGSIIYGPNCDVEATLVETS
jgi:hypothetical protein